MAKKLTITLVVLVISISMILGLTACGDNSSGAFELATTPDKTIPFMTGDLTSTELAKNPARGFSFDLAITLDRTGSTLNNTYAFPSCNHPTHVTGADNTPITTLEYYNAQVERYKAYNPHVVTLTVYLTNFIGVDLTSEALNQMSKYFDHIRRDRNNGFQIVLKFAYQHDPKDAKVQEVDVIRHINRLKEWFQSSYSSTSVKDTIAAFRLSFIGLDGNFDTTGYTKEEVEHIVNAYTEMMPTRKGTYSQAPNVDIKNVSSVYEKLIDMGYYNTNLDSEENAYISGGLDKKSDKYKQYVDESKHNFNSAGVIVDKKNIDGKAVLRQMKDGYFSTFEISNMFTGDAQNKSLIEVWQNTLITKKDLKSMKLPYYDEWFMNADGSSANRSVFDYLRDFTGYHLVASNLTFETVKRVDPNTNKEYPYTKVSVILTNYGLGAPLKLDKIEMSIVNNITGNAVSGGDRIKLNGYDKEALVCGGQVKLTSIEIKGDLDIAAVPNGVTPPAVNPGHSIGIRLYQDAYVDRFVHLANNVKYKNNVNWIYSTNNSHLLSSK